MNFLRTWRTYVSLIAWLTIFDYDFCHCFSGCSSDCFRVFLLMLNDKQVHNIYASFGEELVGRCWENWGGSPMGCSQCAAQISVLPDSMRTSGLRIVSGSLLVTHSQTRWKLILDFFGHHIFVFQLMCGIFPVFLGLFLDLLGHRWVGNTSVPEL